MKQNEPTSLTVTEYISQFFPKFDADTVAARVADKKNTTKEAVLAEWKQAGAESIRLGNKFQKDIFQYVRLPEMIPTMQDGWYEQNCITITNYITKHIKNLEELEREVPVWGRDVYGHIDLHGNVDLHADLIDEKFKHTKHVFEFKMAKMSYENKYQNLLGKYSAFEDTKLFRYLLQLLVYMDMTNNKNSNNIIVGHLVVMDTEHNDAPLLLNLTTKKNQIIPHINVESVSRATPIDERSMKYISLFIKEFNR